MEEPQYFLSDMVAIQHTPNRGRGIFALVDLPEGLLLETAPVIVMPGAQRTLIDQTLLHDYIFIWGEAEDQCCMALGYVALYNHASPANCDYLMDFKQQTISIITVRNIAAGEELLINYNGDLNDEKPVWFAAS